MGDTGVRRSIVAALSAEFPEYYNNANIALVSTHQHSGVGGYLENLLPQITALGYVNALRARAGASAITASQLTLNFILDERARELFWEGHRRTDLVRYGVFSGGTRLWTYKGGVQAGTATASTRDLYPIPANEISANPNLKQNPGY